VVETSRATPADLGGVRAVAAAHDLLGDWPEPPDWLDFLARTGELWVAREDGDVAAFAGVVRANGVAHLTDLFVAPDRLGGGLGRTLLAAAFPAEGPRTTFASSDPRAVALYVRAGLRPLAPMLYLAGTPLGGVEVERVAVAELDLPPRDVLAFLDEAGAYGLVTAEGAGVVRPVPGGARLGPARGDGMAIRALAGAAAAVHGSVKLTLPGPHPALPLLLEAGMHITDADTAMASAPGLLDLVRAVPDADLG
jgi:GNAT superfamily N-acetyltransferase